MEKNKKVGFVYLDELQHLHHFLSSAIELSRNENIDVDILTYEGEHTYLKKLLKEFDGKNINVITLNTFLYRKIIENLSKRKQPSALYIYKKHLRKFLEYDTLVFTDHTAGVIKVGKKDLTIPLLILLGHGAGDGAYGYKKTHNMFDVVIVAGKKKYDRLCKAFPDRKFKLVIGGFGKFEVVKAEYRESNLFDNSNPIILYCPHFKKELSSWHTHGQTILSFFSIHTEYNLIFAPHFNLFNKKATKESLASIEKFGNRPNIHIDLGSIKSTNMTYTLSSNIYLGDVSSQVYEFMYKFRPIIFFNAHYIEWEGDENYKMWSAGKVVNSIFELESALLKVNAWSEGYRSKQKQLFDETFDEEEDSSGIRVSKIIKEEFNGQKPDNKQV